MKAAVIYQRGEAPRLEEFPVGSGPTVRNGAKRWMFGFRANCREFLEELAQVASRAPCRLGAGSFEDAEPRSRWRLTGFRRTASFVDPR